MVDIEVTDGVITANVVLDGEECCAAVGKGCSISIDIGSVDLISFFCNFL